MPEFQIKTGEIISVDAIDLKWIKKYNWSLYMESIRRREYSKSIILAQEILNRKGLKGIVRFKNLNKLDYRRENIIVVSRTKGYKKKNKVANSGHKYIYKVKNCYKVHNEKGIYLGSTETLEKALEIQKTGIRRKDASQTHLEIL